MNTKLFKRICQVPLIFFFLFITLTAIYGQQYSFEKLIRDSKTIVIGKVTKIESKIEEGMNIWTYVTIECDEYLKGKGNTITILRIPGGEVGDIGQYVSGAPKYHVGENTLNFLGQDSLDRYYVNGWEKGKFHNKDGRWFQNGSKQPESFINDLSDMIKSELK